MKSIKNLLTGFRVSLLCLLISSCDEEQKETVFDTPQIEVINTTLTQKPGEPVDVSASIIAPATIKKITVSVDGAAGIDITGTSAGLEVAVATYSFTVPADALDGDTFSIYFEVIDNQDQVAFTLNPTTVIADTNAKQLIEVNESSQGVGTTTWTANNIYLLNGKIYVNDGQTLTIEAGTVIKGSIGQAEAASALIVARGGKIIANGTSTNPIIFTAEADDVTRTDDIPKSQRGLWGGVIILGNAYINHANGQTNIEGIPATSTEARSLYGVGLDAVANKEWPRNDEHNAGEFTYVSIRHGGTNIGSGNEINGLTMGGVGSGTTIHHIEVYGNDDDGFEWFGGTVNTSYLASVYNQDDSFDWDFGWRAQNQFWVGIQEQGFEASNRGIEGDGAHSGNLNTEFFSNPIIYNLTLVGTTASGVANTTDHNVFFFTENSGAKICNSILLGFGQGINITSDGGTNGNSFDRLENGDLAFKNNIWSKVANQTFADGTNSNPDIANNSEALRINLLDSENGNEVSTLPGISISANVFNLLPEANSLSFTKATFALPVTTNGFSYTVADYIGAFKDTNWLKGWTATDAYGFLAN